MSKEVGCKFYILPNNIEQELDFIKYKSIKKFKDELNVEIKPENCKIICDYFDTKTIYNKDFKSRDGLGSCFDKNGLVGFLGFNVKPIAIKIAVRVIGYIK